MAAPRPTPMQLCACGEKHEILTRIHGWPVVECALAALDARPVRWIKGALYLVVEPEKPIAPPEKKERK